MIGDCCSQLGHGRAWFDDLMSPRLPLRPGTGISLTASAPARAPHALPCGSAQIRVVLMDVGIEAT